jgi:hypothetical protein
MAAKRTALDKLESGLMGGLPAKSKLGGSKLKSHVTICVTKAPCRWGACCTGLIELVGAAGLEPATTCLEGRCSIHLSYAPACCLY